MKGLVIDSHKGGIGCVPDNLHWRNAKIISDYLGADLIWSYDDVNEDIKDGYEYIIFNHASHYTYTDYGWIEKNPDAELFYICNDYNLGEPRTLWMAAKAGRKYTVIASIEPKISKIVMKYVKQWNFVNLNSIIYERNQEKEIQDLFEPERNGCVYWGNFRKDRIEYFKKYLTDGIILSTHKENSYVFRENGITVPIGSRIDWYGEGLSRYKYSLYIEDKTSNNHYTHLANRFYESLNYDCIPLFGTECINTINKSNYDIPIDFIINSSREIKDKNGIAIPEEWHSIALGEKIESLIKIKEIVEQSNVEMEMGK